MRFLCLSDIHGHADALSAVLATAERRGYNRVLVAGDICFPGPGPLETWRRLSQIKAICVQGVGDRALATVDTADLRPRDAHERRRLERLLAVRMELGEPILRRLAKLPQMLHQPLDGPGSLLLVHGSPLDPLEPLTHDMEDAAIAHLLGDDPSTVVLCGGSHVPFDRVIERHGPGLPPTTRVINLGSVGEAPGSPEVHAARPSASRARTRAPSRAGQAAAGPHGEASDLTDYDATTAKMSAPSRRFAHATFIDASDGAIQVEQFVVPLGRAA